MESTVDPPSTIMQVGVSISDSDNNKHFVNNYYTTSVVSDASLFFDTVSYYDDDVSASSPSDDVLFFDALDQLPPSTQPLAFMPLTGLQWL